MVELEQTKEGVIVPVQAQPKARRNGLTGTHAGRLKVAVTEAPEKGKANRAVERVLAAELGIRRSDIELVAGATSSSKKFLVSNCELDELKRRIDESLDS